MGDDKLWRTVSGNMCAVFIDGGAAAFQNRFFFSLHLFSIYYKMFSSISKVKFSQTHSTFFNSRGEENMGQTSKEKEKQQWRDEKQKNRNSTVGDNEEERDRKGDTGKK